MIRSLFVVAMTALFAGLPPAGFTTSLYATGEMAGAVHEKFKIVGTVTKVLKEELVVKALDGATYEMDMFESAAIFRQNRKVARTELKPGVKVTVTALGHDMFDLEVVEVHIGN